VNAVAAANVGGGEAQGRTFAQGTGERSRQRYLEAVENPGYTEGDDHKRMKPAPGKSIEARRHIGFDDPAGCEIRDFNTHGRYLGSLRRDPFCLDHSTRENAAEHHTAGNPAA
jgi:hypothetical protein